MREILLREYADREGISPTTARRRARRGKIRAEKRPPRVREDGTVLREHWVVLEGGDEGEDSSQAKPPPAETAEREIQFQTEPREEAPCAPTHQAETPRPAPTERAGGQERDSSPWIVAVILALGLAVQKYGRR